jgi:ribosome-associated protein
MKQNSLTPDANKAINKKRPEEVEAASDERAQVVQTSEQDEGLDAHMLSALHAASDKKALDLLALDLRAIASFTDFFLMASGTNARQVQAIADAISERLRAEGRKPARTEGYNSAEWILLDYGDFIFHIFEEKARRFYDLERLWRDAARTPLPPDIATTNSSGGDSEGSSRTGQ